MSRKKPIQATSNLDWHHYYVQQFNKQPTNQECAILAMLYLFNHLKETDDVSNLPASISPQTTTAKQAKIRSKPLETTPRSARL